MINDPWIVNFDSTEVHGARTLADSQGLWVAALAATFGSAKERALAPGLKSCPAMLNQSFRCL